VGEHEKGWSDWINWKKHTFKRLRLEEFEKEIGDGGRALEIGCAEGKVLEILKKRGWEVVGLEISEYLAKLCQKSDLKVIIGTAEMINFKKEYFNLVLMFHTLEHTTNPVLVLRNIFSMLRKNGRVILEVPCFKNKNELYADFCNLSHFYFFSERGIEKMLSAVGFTYRDKFIYGDELHKPKHNICYLFEKVV
jgi:2-polyprenyl-3-methyl-5-hydroxy-6-metoxy-1,4-benzoquinol methylase